MYTSNPNASLGASVTIEEEAALLMSTSLGGLLNFLAMEASTSSEVNFQIPASSGIPLSVPSVVEGESAISGFTSSFQSEAGSKVGSLPLISSPNGLGKLQSVEGMTIQKSFELMDNVKPIQNVVKALATNDELRNAFLKVKEVQEFTRRLNTGANNVVTNLSSNPQMHNFSSQQLSPDQQCNISARFWKCKFLASLLESEPTH